MIEYKVIIQDDYDNYKKKFLIKAHSHRDAIIKGFKKWMKTNFKEEPFGNYNFKIHISEDELRSSFTLLRKSEQVEANE